MELEEIQHSISIQSPNTFVVISTKHHFKFYLEEKKPFVQTKDYVCDPLWEPTEGYQCLTEVPSLDFKIKLCRRL